MTKPTELERLMSAGLPESDASTALAAMRTTEPGEPYGADAGRAAAVLSRPLNNDGA